MAQIDFLSSASSVPPRFKGFGLVSCRVAESSSSSRIPLIPLKHAGQIQHPSNPEELLWPRACPTAQIFPILIHIPQRPQIDCLIPRALRDLLWKSAPPNWARPPGELR